MNILVPLTHDQHQQFLSADDKCEFISDLLLEDSDYGYVADIGHEAIRALSSAFDGWWVGHCDSIFDVTVYSPSIP